MKLSKKLIIATTLLATASLAADAKVTLWTCGDSSMCIYPTDGSTDKRGWCQYIDAYFQGDIQVIDHAKGGLELHRFFDDDRYFPYLKRNLQPGDYVLIQFAHNEYKNGGMDGYELRDYYLSIGDETAAAAVELRGSVPNGSYIRQLEEAVRQIRELGGNPIFATSIARVKFDGNDISRYGRHDLGDNFSKLTPDGILTRQSLPEDDHSMDYTFQMKELAKKLDVPCIDLMQATRELYLTTGSERVCLDLFTAPSDWSHPNYDAAQAIGRLGAMLLKKKGLLNEYLNVEDRALYFLETDGSLGSGYIHNTIKRDFSLLSFHATPEFGDNEEIFKEVEEVEISVTDGFELSVDNKTWEKSVIMGYVNDAWAHKIYVRASLDNVGTLEGTLRAEAVGLVRELPLTAECLALPVAGDLVSQEVTLSWPLGKGVGDNLDAETSSNQIAEAVMKVEDELMVTGYRAFVPGCYSTFYQAMTNNLPSYSDDASITFTITPKENVFFKPTRFSFYGTRCGTDGGRLQITYECSGKRFVLGTNLQCERDNASEPQTFFDFEVPDGMMTDAPALFRIAICNLGTSKQLAFREVKVDGEITYASAVPELAPESAEVIGLFDLTGKKIALPEEGLYIRLERCADGTVRARKLCISSH